MDVSRTNERSMTRLEQVRRQRDFYAGYAKQKDDQNLPNDVQRD